ncbi:hypothetical protein FB45DRAFT_1082269 [Roridomyces roridus]|uniref:Uncharacterized protein n=1 Tax=Roridomyces roridus TaxID=1738132 RepID=A0AAD7FLW6_9AGAR|nr:hypothetical protein FB45DRAFT_1082269 [Roridomyces roridus]
MPPKPAPSFPDEIISEILTPVLLVPDAKFANTSEKSVFAVYTESTSAVLLVCKAWLRVSTPLLYNVVVLRSSAQAKALHRALKDNPALGKFIKKLRVEGGFGTYMHGILQSALGITDIFISLMLHASDSTSGLVQGLPLISPRRLVIWDEDHKVRKNKQVKQLMETLEKMATKWSNLTTLVSPFSGWLTAAERLEFIIKMASTSSATTVSLPADFGTIRTHALDLARITSIQKVEIRAIISSEDAQTLLSQPEFSKLRSKLRIVDPRWHIPPSTPAAPHPVDPTFMPMTACPQNIIDVVWSNVLFFLMAPDYSSQAQMKATIEIVSGSFGKSMNDKRLRYLRVCKTFHRVGLPYLYRWPVLRATNTAALCRKLEQEPSLGLHVREFASQISGVLTQGMRTLFAHTPRLTRLGMSHRVNMDWAVFRTLAETSGASLVELSVHVVPDSDAPVAPNASLFCLFTALRKLARKADFFLSPSDSGGLPALERLELVDGVGILPALISMDLPNIQHVIFPVIKLPTALVARCYQFLTNHGNKMHELQMLSPVVAQTLVLCPNLRTLDISLSDLDLFDLETYAQGLSPSQPHNFLAKLKISKYQRRRKADEDASWDVLFQALLSLNFANLPALTDLQIMQCEWPAPNERAIDQSPWVERAEGMLEHGIQLTDARGVHWRPRLKI